MTSLDWTDEELVLLFYSVKWRLKDLDQTRNPQSVKALIKMQDKLSGAIEKRKELQMDTWIAMYEGLAAE